MKNILLLTDFSESSINAIRYALHLFKDDVCTFYILHVESSSGYSTSDLMLAGNESIYSTIIKKTKGKLNELVLDLQSEFSNKNFKYEILVDYDVLIESIKQVQQSKKIDLIVIGTNGVSGAKEVVFGSNTINVIRKINCPTLIIPEGFKYTQPKEILLPLDLFDAISSSAFMEVVNFTNRFSKILHILRINPNNEKVMKEQNDMKHIHNFLKDASYTYHTVNNVPMHYVVSCYSQTHTIDLTVLIVQKESLFERFFTGSPTTKISNKIKTPLLIFHS